MKQVLRGELIRDYVYREGRKLCWVAAQIGVSESVLSKMTRGYAPKMEPILKLSKLLGVKVSSLLIDEEDAA